MILCAGELLVDKIVTAGGAVCHVGGAPFNVAVNAVRAGAGVRFYGNIGKDATGEFLLAKAGDYGVQLCLTVDDLHPTTVALVQLDEKGERSFRFLRDNAADYYLDASLLDWNGVTTLHLGTLMLNTAIGRDFFAKAVVEAQKRGVRVTVDANFRDDLFASQEQRNATMLPYLLQGDVLKLGHDELASLTHCATIDEGAAALSYEGLLFVTAGADGSAVYRKGVCLAKANAQKVEHVVDTTGAGDAFFGTVVALLDSGVPLDGDSLTHILNLANRAGAAATQTEGAL